MQSLKNKYELVKFLMEHNKIERFTDIFEYIPKTTVAKDLGLNYLRLDKISQNLEDFHIRHIKKVAELLDVNYRKVFDLVFNEIDNKDLPKKKPTPKKVAKKK